ncbi:unnamed protein product [Mucor hiemalis]
MSPCNMYSSSSHSTYVCVFAGIVILPMKKATIHPKIFSKAPARHQNTKMMMIALKIKVTKAIVAAMTAVVNVVTVEVAKKKEIKVTVTPFDATVMPVDATIEDGYHRRSISP